MSTYTTKAKAWLRQLKHGYTDMGGYPLFAVREDSHVLCPKCCTKEAKLIMRAGQDRDKQWQLAGVDVNWEDAELFCDHCNKRIESAYAEDEATRKSNPMGHVAAPAYTRVLLQFRNANTQADVATSCRCVVEQKEKRTDPWVHVDGGHWTTESNARIDMRNMKAMYDVEDRGRNPKGKIKDYAPTRIGETGSRARKTRAYTISLNDREVSALAWAVDRGYFPEEAYDKMSLADGEQEDVGSNTQRMWEIPESAAWSISSMLEDDPDAFLSSIGGELHDKVMKLVEKIV